MSELWIKASGLAAPAQLPALAESYTRPGQCGLAFFTDHFSAFYCPAPAAQEPTALEDLLELRIFDADSEFWAHRSMVGQPFHWRVADDTTLRQGAAALSDPFLQQAAHHQLPSRQTLDIDATYQPADGALDAQGCVRLRTTGGGHYALPLAPGQDTALLTSYLHYDENGVATVADTRLCGFGAVKEKSNAKGDV